VADAQPRIEPASRSSLIVNAALLCERVLQESDGTLSAVRIVDQLTYQAIPRDSPPDAEVVPAPMRLALLLMVKDPAGSGDHALQIVARPPSGEPSEVGAQSVQVALGQGQVAGANVVVNLVLALKEEGLHWFDIHLDNALLTSVPLHVRFDSAG
jgi:hypothetical protein